MEYKHTAAELIAQARTWPKDGFGEGRWFHAMADEIERLRAGIQEQDAPDPLDEWKGMESAPKDGTRILALVTEKQFYRDTSTPNELIPVVVRWAGRHEEWSMPGIGGLRPTLWLPIRLVPQQSHV